MDDEEDFNNLDNSAFNWDQGSTDLGGQGSQGDQAYQALQNNIFGNTGGSGTDGFDTGGSAVGSDNTDTSNWMQDSPSSDNNWGADGASNSDGFGQNFTGMDASGFNTNANQDNGFTGGASQMWGDATGSSSTDKSDNATVDVKDQDPSKVTKDALENTNFQDNDPTSTGSISKDGGATDDAKSQRDKVLDQIGKIESNNNPNAKNPRSSASGEFQFTNGTWLQTVKTAQPDWAQGLSNQEIMAAKNDPDKQREMAGALTDQNGTYLKNKGIEDTPGNLYAAHFLGAGGAAKVLSQDPSTPMTQAVSPQVIAANPFLQKMNVGDFQAWTDRKMAPALDGSGNTQYASLNGGGGGANQDTGGFSGGAGYGFSGRNAGVNSGDATGNIPLSDVTLGGGNYNFGDPSTGNTGSRYASNQGGQAGQGGYGGQDQNQQGRYASNQGGYGGGQQGQGGMPGQGGYGQGNQGGYGGMPQQNPMQGAQMGQMTPQQAMMAQLQNQQQMNPMMQQAMMQQLMRQRQQQQQAHALYQKRLQEMASGHNPYAVTNNNTQVANLQNKIKNTSDPAKKQQYASILGNILGHNGGSHGGSSRGRRA